MKHSVNNKNSEIIKLGDHELLSQLTQLVKTERVTTVEILLHLVEVERRRLYVPRGHSALFSYVTKELGYSAPAAKRRIASARVIQRYPEAHQLLATNQVNITTLSLVSAVLTAQNNDELLRAISGKSRDEVERIVSSYRPRPCFTEKIKPLSIQHRTPTGDGALESIGTTSLEMFQSPSKLQKVRGEPSVKLSETVVESFGGTHECGKPEIEQRYQFQFSVSAQCKSKFHRVQALASNKFPRGGSCEDIFELLLDEYLSRHCPNERHEKRKAAKKTDQELVKKHENKRGRYIPIAIQDAVFERDGGRCTYVSPDGTRCGSQHRLQIDHITPFAKRGSNDEENLRLRCAVHNRYEAEQAYGKAFMSQFYQKEKVRGAARMPLS